MNEKPFSGKYWDHDAKGIYTCAVCGNELFSSKAKFDPGGGWASFLKPLHSESVAVKDDKEISCRQCGALLGEFAGDKDRHYRVNSIALDFEEAEESTLMANLKDELQGQAQDKLQEWADGNKNQNSPSQTPAPAWSFKNVVVLLGAVALGAGVGAGISNVYAGLMCQIGSSQTPLPAATSLHATSTLPKPPTKPSPKPAGGASVPPKPTSTPIGTDTSTTPATTTSSTGI